MFIIQHVLDDLYCNHCVVVQQDASNITQHLEQSKGFLWQIAVFILLLLLLLFHFILNNNQETKISYSVCKGEASV